MRATFAKISLFLVITFLSSCNAVKKVAEDQLLLTDVTINENGKRNNQEEVRATIIQKPNAKALGIPLRLHLYNMAKEDPDSSYSAWLKKKPKREARLNRFLSKKQTKRLGESFLVKGLSNFLKETGEPPVIIDRRKTNRSLRILENHYQSNGFFNAKTHAKVIPSEKRPLRASIVYDVITGNPYYVDSVATRIASPELDSILKSSKEPMLIKQGKQFNFDDFSNERDRLTTLFRNNGVYNFQKSSIVFDIDRDTVSGNYKLPTTIIVNDLQIRERDSVATIPYKIHTVEKVNVYTDDSFANQQSKYTDSVSFNDVTIYSKGKLRYRPKALTDAVFITKGNVYRDLDRTRTNRTLNSLRTFKFPNISYQYLDTAKTALAANIYLTPQKRFSLGFDVDLTQSNIQAFGISLSTSVLARNIFRGAETLEFSLSGTLGASKDINRSESQFFDLLEGGADLRINFPRIFFPFNTNRIVPKYMQPTTVAAIGTNLQQNIGLDKQNFTALIQYQWLPSKRNKSVLELMSVEFVNNRNPNNYFNIYTNSFNDLNQIAINAQEIAAGEQLGIPEQADDFLAQAIATGNPLGLSSTDLSDARAINERKDRLTENNLIFASNYTFTHNNREGITDLSFSQFRTKIEFAGNALSAMADLFDLEEDEGGQRRIFDVAYSQYIKTELDYIKHWRVGRQQSLAFRSFMGIAIPYGNAESIPFNRSYFAGGANDNRGWSPYSLGPGSSGGLNEFNEANLKIALNLEYRFDLFGNLEGAFFADGGNIWHVFDTVEDPAFQFSELSDLGEIAIGSGFGLRYDFDFFVFRLDTGFKTYDPGLPEGSRWFTNFNFGNAVFNIGINYPF